MAPPQQPVSVAQLRAHMTAAQLEDCFFYSSDEQYQASLDSYFSNQARCLTPLAIARPRTAEDVAGLVKAILQLRETIDLKFAIRSGGHCVWAGAANIECGITIDLRKLNHVEIHRESSTADVGAGAVWGDVYQNLIRSGITVPGGRVADVGVGGLALGGGISYYSPRVGFVCDNIVSYQIVLADGTLTTVTQESHPDLWWALKGGGNNFGIVTKFTIRTFPAGDMFGGCFVYPITTAHDHIKAFHNFANVDKDLHDEKAGVISVYSFRAGQGRSVFKFLTYTEPVDRPSALSGFLNVGEPIYSTGRITSQFDLTFEHTKFLDQNFQNCYLTTTVHADDAMLHAIFEIWEKTVPEIEHIPGISWAVGFQVLHPGTMSKSAALGGNCMGLSNAQSLVIVLITNSCESPSDNHALVTKSKNLLASIEAEAKRRNKYSPFKYLNYAWSDQDVFAGYGAENKARLQQIAEKYDPKKFYQTAMPGGFKLW